MLKDNWIDKVNNVDYIYAEDVNSIAHAVISAEDEIEKLKENGEELPKGSVKTEHIADDAVTGDKIGEKVITEKHLANGAVGGGAIKTLSIVESRIRDGAITTAKLADGAVTLEKLADGVLLQGKDGADGYTPVRGIDYWTDSDKAEIQADAETFIAEELAKRGQLKPEFANSTDECTDTDLLYVLPNNFIYAYMRKHIVQKTNEYNASTAKLNTRINSSGEEKELAGCLTTDFVEVSLANPYIVNISGVTLNLGYGTYVSINYYNASKTWLGVKKIEDINYSPDIYDAVYANAVYVRLQLGIKTEIAITEADVADLFIEFVPKTIDEEVTGWHSTGHAFVPADYEDRIVALEENVANLKENDAESESITLPSYWQEAADEAVAKVKAIQDEGGNNIVNFVWFSDMHHHKGNQYTQNIGKLCAYVMNACNIPLCLMNGDTMSADSVAEESTLLEWLDDANDVLAPIGKDRLLRVKGNHDDVYGSYTDGDTTTYYVNKVAPAKIYNRIFRPQAEDFRRVFGGDGSYFYVDTPQNVRIVCLNSHFYNSEAITDGTTGASSFGFGADQIAWLGNALLTDGTVDKAVVVLHTPPTASEINGRTDYLSLLSDGADFRSALSTGDIPVIGIFCGHAHADANVADDLGIPIVTITCAINSPYNAEDEARVAGTITETAIDIVSINKETGTIKTTRLGIGSDRVIEM